MADGAEERNELSALNASSFAVGAMAKTLVQYSFMRIVSLAVFILPFVACSREVTVGQLPSALERVTVNETTRGIHLIVN